MTSYPPPPPTDPGQPAAPPSYTPPPTYVPPPQAPPTYVPPPQAPAYGSTPMAPSAPMQSPYPQAPTQEVKAPAFAWLIPLAALLAIIGAATPWFKASGKAGGVTHTFSSLYSWKDGKIGLVAPILLLILAISVIGMLQGKTPARFAKGSAHPLKSAGKTAIGFGLVAIVCMVIAWFLVTHQYKFDIGTGTNVNWDYLTSHGVTMSRGPQIGYWLTGVAGVLSIVAGVLLLVTTKVEPSAAPQPPQPPQGPSFTK